MTWRRRGRIFPVAGESLPDWVGGAGALPFAVPDGARRCPVFFSGRDALNRTQIGSCVLDLDGLAIVAGTVSPEPLVRSGPAGAFDESGCSMSCVVVAGGRWYLYYSGWTLGRTVPFYLGVGLAVSEDRGATFTKLPPPALVGRGAAAPMLCASPSVLIEGGVWRMWYVSGVRWEKQGDAWRHYYLLQYAESSDGLLWRADGRVCVGFATPAEYALGRPHVVKDGDLYRMWFCARGDAYRLGYAESRDGLDWERRDIEADLGSTAAGWDADMQAYPMVFRDGERWVMLYNGNAYGATGFGCATAESHGASSTG